MKYRENKKGIHLKYARKKCTANLFCNRSAFQVVILQIFGVCQLFYNKCTANIFFANDYFRANYELHNWANDVLC